MSDQPTAPPTNAEIYDFTAHKLLAMIDNCENPKLQEHLMDTYVLYSEGKLTVRWINGSPVFENEIKSK
jgi:hypothetical protein